MHILGSPLYQQSARDLAGGRIQALFRRAQVTTTAISITGLRYDVPADSVLLLSNAFLQASPGAAQVCTAMTVDLCDEASTQIAQLDGTIEGAAGIKLLRADFHDLWIPPGAGIRLNANFDAGAVANSVVGHIAGVLIPRGNFPSL